MPERELSDRDLRGLARLVITRPRITESCGRKLELSAMRKLLLNVNSTSTASRSATASAYSNALIESGSSEKLRPNIQIGSMFGNRPRFIRPTGVGFVPAMILWLSMLPAALKLG